ncbi:hypothetical protein GPECTOR_6g532 [Gonium pectorale]|uniref:Uncharacterized protein n=1 Tax=Gonium pectorale TaxID=33097 RepID=A0A150GUS0_GONPE|nr:hypothetical protein GPECTOR_6g532 [Gonium pectorale]|eukprot:KXZ53615.1 hypothetical protein GPECTOR_6g532 [Gonium pectorale]
MSCFTSTPGPRTTRSYRVIGPARISRRGDSLIAYLYRGSRLELYDRHGNPTPLSSGSSMGSMAEEEMLPGPDADSPDGSAEGCVAECVLVGAHVELCGSACSVDLVDLSVQPAVLHHNGHTYLSVRSLPPEAVIELDAGADLRHPINVTPPAPSEY